MPFSKKRAPKLRTGPDSFSYREFHAANAAAIASNRAANARAAIDAATAKKASARARKAAAVKRGAGSGMSAEISHTRRTPQGGYHEARGVGTPTFKRTAPSQSGGGGKTKHSKQTGRFIG